MSQATTILDTRDASVRALIGAEIEDPEAIRRELRARAAARRFDLAKPPPEPVPRFYINGKAVCTPGNLSNIIAQAKAGKSSVISAAIAACIVAQFALEDRDCLGITATAPGGYVVLHLDTEQSPFDHHALMRRTLRRAGVSEAPPWLHSYGVAGFTASELRQLLQVLLEDIVADGSKVFCVILDGTADMVNDVNDPAECNGFVAELHGLAIRYETPIVNVVHENPGDPRQANGKMRGHLGSQLERKAESNLRLRKTDEVTVIFSEKMRRAPILEKDGPRFKWDDEAGMHVTCESAGEARDGVKRERSRDLMAGAFEFAEKPRLRHGELLDAIAKFRRIGKSAAEDRFSEAKHLRVIEKNPISGEWSLASTP